MSSEAEEEPVSVLQRFEKRLEGLVEGAFAKVFKGVVHPVEILNAMQREAEAHKAILAGGRTLVPNRYVIDLSPYDHSRLAPYAAALAQELAQSQAEFIGEQAWTVYGDVIVEINRTKVTAADAAVRVLKGSQGDLLLLVTRRGASQYVVIKR